MSVASSGRKRGRRLWDELADLLDGRTELAVANAPRQQRWKVLGLSPLTFGQLQGELVLSEGDPDLDITQWVRTYNHEKGLAIGDVVLVAYVDEEYTVQDVVSGTAIRWRGQRDRSSFI